MGTNSGTRSYTKLHKLYDTRNQLCCLYFTRSNDVTLSVHLMVVERKLRGRFARVFLRFLMPSEKLDKLGKNLRQKAALEQHITRASLQSQGWIRATHLDHKLPNPSHCGWTKDIHCWTPLSTTLPQAAKS